MQGGTKHFEYPKYVWSPAGGWWCNPRHWKRNTAIAFAISGALAGVMWYISAQLEVHVLYISCILYTYWGNTTLRLCLHISLRTCNSSQIGWTVVLFMTAFSVYHTPYEQTHTHTAKTYTSIPTHTVTEVVQACKGKANSELQCAIWPVEV